MTTASPPQPISATLKDHLGSLYYRYAPSRNPQAPVITLITGYARTHSDLRFWQKKLQHLGMSVLISDLRGSGASQAQRPFPFTTWRDDILTLWQHLRIQNSSILGFSMGGVIAQSLACTVKVPQLILISTLSNPRHFTPLGSATPLGSTTPGPRSVLDQTLLWHPLPFYFSPQYLQSSPQMCAQIQRDIENIANSPVLLRQVSYQRQAFANAPFADLTHPHMPTRTLIIHGNQDRIISPHAAQDLHSRFQPSPSTLKIYPQCGHLLLLENPKQLWQDVSTFLSSPPPSPS